MVRETDKIFEIDMKNLYDYHGNTVTNSGSTLANDQLNRLNNARHCTFNQGVSSQYFDVNDTTTLNDFTFSFFAKNDGASGSTDVTNLIINDKSTGNLAQFSWYNSVDTSNPNKIAFYNGTAYYYSTQTLNLDTWYHICYTRSGTTLKIYINGNLDSTHTVSSTALPSSGWRIGGYYALVNRYAFDGSLADLKAWDVALTTTEVLEEYNSIKNNYETLFTNCVLYLDMNGDAKDVTNNNNDGTVTGATLTTDHLGNQNRAYLFGASTDLINIPTSTDFEPTSFTVSMWIYPTSTTANAMLLDNYTSPSSFYGFYIDSSSTNVITVIIYAGSGSTNYNTTTTTTFADNTWTYLTVTYDGTTTRIYFNGVEASYSQQNTGTIGYNTGTHDVNIGNRTGGGRNFNGKIAPPIYFTRAFSIDEVKELYDITKTKYIYLFPQGVGE